MPRSPANQPSSSADDIGSVGYLLHVELRYFKPAIYRDVIVDPSIPLSKLHKIIQAAMGWEDAHLYGFALHNGKPSASYWRALSNQKFEPPQNDDGMGWDRSNSDRTTLLSHVLRKPKDKLLYMYDFGDDWEHLITLKDIVRTKEPMPWLVKAQNACPPEDCGGMPGFVNMLDAFTNPKHPEHEGVREWLGDDFEPGAFDFSALQAAVKRLQPKKRA
jgi:Plasmid pRiA4b ORF-3-like protein